MGQKNLRKYSVLGRGLFKGNYFENKLKLEKIVKEKEDIVQVHYSVVKEENPNE